MWRKALLTMALMALIVAPAKAQRVSIGPQVGYYRAQDADEGSFMGGVALRFKVMPILGAEASINYRQEEYFDGALTVRSWPVMVTGLIYPLPFVYGAIGFGWYNVTADYDDSELPLLEDGTYHIVYCNIISITAGKEVDTTVTLEYLQEE